MNISVIVFFVFCISNGFTKLVLNNRYCKNLILDYPVCRSLHSYPVPRIGGIPILIGIFAGVLLATLSFRFLFFWSPIFGLASLIVISFIDDRIGIAAIWRIWIHLLAAIGLLAVGLDLNQFVLFGYTLSFSGWISVLLTLLFIVWMINLYNFMDGMDGFAGGMAVVGFATLAWLGQADAGFAAICLIVAAASAGFLVHNFPPAKIFLGDTGSTTLGFLAAACSLWGNKNGLFPFWVALLVFSPFIVDATVTLLRRLLRGEKIWEAHRTHYYQRLVLLGLGQRRTVLAEYVLMLACAGSAAWAIHLSPAGQMILVCVWVLIYGVLMLGVGWLERRHVTVSTR